MTKPVTGTIKVSKRGSASPGKAAPAADQAPRTGAERSQQQLFDEAIRAFHAREFARAKPLFEAAAQGASREMAHSARLHVRMCEHRLRNAPPVLESAEELYNFAVALINRGEFAAAEGYLLRALEQAANADHLHYAMALCRGRQGDIEGAHRHLKRAIDLEPRNRTQARADADFGDLVRRPEISALLFPGRDRV